MAEGGIKLSPPLSLANNISSNVYTKHLKLGHELMIKTIDWNSINGHVLEAQDYLLS